VKRVSERNERPGRAHDTPSIYFGRNQTKPTERVCAEFKETTVLIFLYVLLGRLIPGIAGYA
jgi:hypothetical protein